MKLLTRESCPPVFVAAVIASAGIYLGVPILRGAIWGLFPGIAKRSLPLCLKGIAFGALFDLFYEVAWVDTVSFYFLRMFWNSRGGDSPFLTDWLPGQRYSAADFYLGGIRGPESSATKFWCGIEVWFLWMIFCWWIVWTPRPSMRQLLRASAVGMAAASVACAALWYLSPWYDWRGGVEYPLGVDLGTPLWTVMYIAVFPICVVLIAKSFVGHAEQSLAAESR
jgi:hypothetical protein